MSGIKNIITNDAISTSPLGFDISKATITANNGLVVDLRPAVHDIKIHEGLHRSGIIVEIYVVDAANLTNELKLSGSEEINLEITRIEPDIGPIGYSLKLYIADINKFTEPTPGSKAYSLTCVSKHVYLNNKKLINSPFHGTITNLIKSLAARIGVDELSSGQGKELTGVSFGIIKGIIPNMTALDAISWLLRNAVDNGTQVYFYESAAEGLVLTSYNHILNNLKQDGVYSTYNRNPYHSTSMSVGGKAAASKMFQEERLKIRKMVSSLNVSKLKATSRGAYASKISTIDIADKRTPTKIALRYTGDNILNEYPSLNDKMTIGDEKISDFDSLKHHYINVNSFAWPYLSSQGKPNNYHYPMQSERLLKSRMTINNLDTNVVEVELGGDFLLSPGRVVNLNILKQADITQELEDGTDPTDQYISGNYLVSSIIHHFGKDGYIMKTKLKKDSFKEEQIRTI